MSSTQPSLFGTLPASAAPAAGRPLFGGPTQATQATRGLFGQSTSFQQPPVQTSQSPFGSFTSTVAKPFVPLYGEPAWQSRPIGEPIEKFPISSNASYEENRLRETSGTTSSTTDIRVSQAPLSTTTRRIYLKWYSSPHVEVLVGSEEASFKLPGDFLARRSRPFSVMIGSNFKEADSRTIRLPETTPETFEHVLIWCISTRPVLDRDLPLATTIDIAIFATIYMMPSLLHQTLDLLLKHFSSFHKWTPELLGRVYRLTDAESSLRRFARATLSTLDGSVFETFEKVLESSLETWRPTFEEHPELGFDYFVMKRTNCTMLTVQSKGSCWFHEHAPEVSKNYQKPFTTTACRLFEDAEYFQDVNELGKTSALNDLTDQIKVVKVADDKPCQTAAVETP